MRIVKDAAVRKNEILDCASALFLLNGYEQTSTEDILREVGIARGTLYYHFKSKEEILDGLIARTTDDMASKAFAIVHDESASFYEKLSGVLFSMKAATPESLQLIDQAHQPENILLHQKMHEQAARKLIPLIAELIEQGNQLNECSNPYPLQTAEMTFLYGSMAFDAIPGNSPDEILKTAEAFIFNLERLLNTQNGKLREVMMRALIHPFSD